MKKRPLATRQAAQGMRPYIAELIANLVSRFCWHHLPLGFVYPHSYSNCESSHVAAADHPRRVRHRRQDRNIAASVAQGYSTCRFDAFGPQNEYVTYPCSLGIIMVVWARIHDTRLNKVLSTLLLPRTYIESPDSHRVSRSEP